MAKTAERIKDIMTTGVVSIGPDEKVQKAVDIMADRNISCVVVTESDDSKRPIGLITERDLVRRVLKTGKDAKKLKAKAIMTSSLVTISEEASLEEGMRVIENMHIRRLPVVSRGAVVGLVTQSDIVHETYNIHSFNKKLMFHQSIQSYVIIALAAFFVIVFLYRAFF